MHFLNFTIWYNHCSQWEVSVQDSKLKLLTIDNNHKLLQWLEELTDNKMTRETWEMWADEYQEYYEAEDYEGLDDIEAWKEEEQKVIDELIQRMQGAYNDV